MDLERRSWRNRLDSVGRWFGSVQYEAWHPDHGGGNAAVSCRETSNEDLEIVFEERFPAYVCRTSLLCGTGLVPKVMHRNEVGSQELIRFGPDVPTRNGRPLGSARLPVRFFTPLSELILAATLPWERARSFVYEFLDTDSWSVVSDRTLVVSECQELRVAQGSLLCWHVRHDDASYWVTEDRTLLGFVIGDRGYWLSEVVGSPPQVNRPAGAPKGISRS